ncbi:NADH-quinone oxidoreductase subunit NuoG [Buchnera aphidicola (Thelaxes californica)]|uniref:NADH-quinone oxidoreductase subunit G n=1 Tax=Buchnera aphidicola (Thelaxes californica) TaxID=1315998 RepID=A0A4D6YBB2_9GAMM|nr:NADH-quinone oxidoreductase subunit NuoG [Buchnera aphidicola]QCI26679.1 NADH-quinone oxidoreductase subunit NuoG [Buchnera aphidicola (Thelaxes californica)]
MVTIYIDNKSYNAHESNNLLQTCLQQGLDIPYFCWHPVLGSVGSCRQCAVKKYANDHDEKGFIVMSCMTAITKDLRISIKDPEAVQMRRQILELLMTNHPHDCPVCPEGGNCHLQDMTVMTQHHKRRYHFEKKIYNNQYLGPFIQHEMNRCISCYRCVRFYKDYAGGKDFNVFGTANNLYFGRFTDGILESEHSGNLIEICPTGVFTDKTQSEHYNRKWDMQYAPSICQHCSIGCNISVGERYGMIRKVENRFNTYINSYFICDIGRFFYRDSNNIHRTSVFQYRNQKKLLSIDYETSLLQAVNLFQNSEKIIGIGSSRSSIENNFALLKLVGEKNFSSGMLKLDNEIISYITSIIQNKKIHIPTLSEVEKYDFIIIIGEDILKTAPRLSLSVRQAIKNNNINVVNDIVDKKIFSWQSDAIKNVRQNKQAAFFIIHYLNTDLDELCSMSYDKTMINPLFLSTLINKKLNNEDITIDLETIDSSLLKYITTVVNALKKSKNPLIISGSHCRDKQLIQITVNIFNSIQQFNNNVGLILLTPDVNSIGLGMMNGMDLNSVISIVEKNKKNTLVCLEHDIYTIFPKFFLKKILKNSKTSLIVLDHKNTRTMQKAHLKIPVTNHFESSGTVINYEGRIQRFFQVYNAALYKDNIYRVNSWRWLHALQSKIEKKNIHWLKLDDVIKSCSKQLSFFENIINVTPNSSFRIFGQKIPRSPQRFSGRTAIDVHRNIHENTQPQDLDSMFSFSMEGSQIYEQYSSEIPFHWSPGWNSVQSSIKSNLNMLDNDYNNSKKNVFINVNTKIKKPYHHHNFHHKNIVLKYNCLKIIPYYCLFEQHNDNIMDNIKNKKNHGIINILKAKELNIPESSIIILKYGSDVFKINVKFSNNINSEYVAISLGTYDLPFFLSGKLIQLLKGDEWKIVM